MQSFVLTWGSSGRIWKTADISRNHLGVWWQIPIRPKMHSSWGKTATTNHAYLIPDVKWFCNTGLADKIWYKQQSWGFHMNLCSRHGYLVPSPRRFNHLERGIRPNENRIQPHWESCSKPATRRGIWWAVATKMVDVFWTNSPIFTLQNLQRKRKDCNAKSNQPGKTRVKFLDFPSETWKPTDFHIIPGIGDPSGQIQNLS